ncbi:MAG: FAD-dependent oxidoreductase [Verrucomicrobiota bacterium]|jgi:ferredoxin
MNAFAITFDGAAVPVAEGETILQVARRLGVDIPTLCFLETCTPATSCLVCLVKIKLGGAGKLVPSCATRVAPGMVVESETPEVHAARRTALELLFSDHVGDCLSPCHRLCPLQLNVPVMLRQTEAGELDAAIATVRQALPLPAVLGRLCHHPCENGCRRGTRDQPAAIRDVERFVADHDRQSSQPYQPPAKPRTGKRVAIVGTGPTGLAAAFYLVREGHAVTLFDRREQAGGSLLREVASGTLPAEVLAAEIKRLETLGAVIRTGVALGTTFTLEMLVADHDAVLVAVGESAKTQAVTLGLGATPGGLKVDPDGGATSMPKVFAAGSAVKPTHQVLRAMADGRVAALALNQFLHGLPIKRPTKPFSSIMGRLDPLELKRFMVGPSPVPRAIPPLDLRRGFSPTTATEESGRCLHCDCRAAGNCQLEHYAELYAADTSRYRSQRRAFEQFVQPGGIVFEPGKCILCGLCVQIAERAREPLGLTFVGRGFDVRIAVPFNRSLDEGLQKVGRECVAACPTGALAFKEP